MTTIHEGGEDGIESFTDKIHQQVGGQEYKEQYPDVARKCGFAFWQGGFLEARSGSSELEKLMMAKMTVKAKSVLIVGGRPRELSIAFLMPPMPPLLPSLPRTSPM